VAFQSRPLAERHKIGRFSTTAFLETLHETLLKRYLWYTIVIVELRFTHKMRARGETH